MADRLVLLICDLVGSTAVSAQRNLDALSSLMVEHDRTARALIGAWRGREIDKSDGFLLTFGEPSDAIGWATAYHEALAKLPAPLQARVGIHLGEVTLQPNDTLEVQRGAKPMEVHGLGKSIVARVSAMAGAGQTLLTAEAAATVAESAQRLVSHGHWQINGLDDPIEVFEVGVEDAAFEPPPDSSKAYRVVWKQMQWVPRHCIAHSLPAERDRFIGRSEEARSIADLIGQGVRLVTLHGPGGVGKTRLATRFAMSRLGTFPDGAWFCDLTQATTSAGVVYAVATGLGVPLVGADPVAQLLQVIRARGKCLLVVDNAEQVVEHLRGPLRQWLDGAPDVTFLVTTRQRLGLRGEHVVTLGPMRAEEGLLLFEQRCRQVCTSLKWDEIERHAACALVGLLDALPLAIELAAARANVMSPTMLRDRIHERFRLLADSGAEIDRHSTLRKALDWSWDLLDDAERTALAQLSVFAGSFALDAAEEIVVLSVADQDRWLADVFQSLIEKSFVQRQGGRFSLLLTVQQYSRERWASLPPSDGGDAIDRHMRRYCRQQPDLSFESKRADLENVIAACRRAVAAPDCVRAVQGIDTAWSILKLTGPFAVASSLAESCLKLPGCTKDQSALIHLVLGEALAKLGSVSQALESLTAGVKLAEISSLKVRLLTALAEQFTHQGNATRALQLLKTADELAVFCNEGALRIHIGNASGAAWNSLGRSDRATICFTTALKMAVARDDRRWEGGLRGNLACQHVLAGDYTLARDSFERALGISRTFGDLHWEGNTRSNLGMVLLELGQCERAVQELNSAHGIALFLGNPFLASAALANMGLAYLKLNQFSRACEVWMESANQAEIGEAPALQLFALSWAGWAYVKLGDLSMATETFGSAGMLAEHSCEHEQVALYWCQLARSRLLLEHFDEAVELKSAMDRYVATHAVVPGADLAPVLALLDAEIRLRTGNK